MCVPFPFLPVGSFYEVSQPSSFRRGVPSEHGHMHMQIYSAGALVSAARGCAYMRVHVRTYTCVRLYDSTLRGACMRICCGEPVVQADRGGEGHKLNDVNALSTLCRCETAHRATLSRPPPSDWLLPSPPLAPPTATIVATPFALTLDPSDGL